MPPVPDVPDLPDIPEVVIDWWPPPGFPPIPQDPRPPVIEDPPLPPWQDPQEPSVPGTGGGGGDDLNNGGPTGITRHRYVARSATDRHCRVCGKWQNTALHINREPERPRPDRPGGTGGTGGNPGGNGADNRPHKWTRRSLTNPACKVCGRPRNSGIHTNPETPKPPRPPQRPGGATGHPVGGGGGGAGTGNGGGGGNGGGHGATGGPVSHGVGPADTPHRYKAISATNKHCEVCNRWRDTWVHTNRNG